MGMAASQARFLGLTARKSNTEYQGQQINQQRTALSNESSALYTQMMDLTVPTPPQSSDYTKITYTLDDSAGSYANSDYTLVNATKTYNQENEYKVTLSTKKSYTAPTTTSYKLGSTKSGETLSYYVTPYSNFSKNGIVNSKTGANNGIGDVPYKATYTETMETGKKYKVNRSADGYKPEGYDEYVKDNNIQDTDNVYCTKNEDGTYTFSNKLDEGEDPSTIPTKISSTTLGTFEKNTIYTIDRSMSTDTITDEQFKSDYEAFLKDNESLSEDSKIYYYQDENGKNHFMTAAEYKENSALTSTAQTDNGYSIKINDTTSGNSTTLTYCKEGENPFTGDNGSLQVESNRIYKIDNTSENLDSIEDFTTCCTDPAQYYFYQDASGKNHFLTEDQVNKMLSGDNVNTVMKIGNAYSYDKDFSTTVVGIIEKGESGRYSSISIDEDDSYPNDLNGKVFSISTAEVQDEDAYNDAFNDYEYQKAEYDKKVSDINAQTELIQQKDEQLELRLKQLDTEQNALKTEMDAVQKVIEDNVENTFKIFA